MSQIWKFWRTASFRYMQIFHELRALETAICFGVSSMRHLKLRVLGTWCTCAAKPRGKNFNEMRVLGATAHIFGTASFRYIHILTLELRVLVAVYKIYHRS